MKSNDQQEQGDLATRSTPLLRRHCSAPATLFNISVGPKLNQAKATLSRIYIRRNKVTLKTTLRPFSKGLFFYMVIPSTSPWAFFNIQFFFFFSDNKRHYSMQAFGLLTRESLFIFFFYPLRITIIIYFPSSFSFFSLPLGYRKENVPFFIFFLQMNGMFSLEAV